MGNSRALQKATKELTKAKAPSTPRDMIYDPRGQWAHPGQNTRIPGGDITMQGVPYPVYAQPNVGQPQMMYPGQEYTFPGADYVDEYPQMKRGGYTRGLVPMPKPSKKGLASKAYSRSLDATNKLFTENYLFKKPKDRKRKVFDPNAKYYADGGEYGMPLGAGVAQNFIGNRDDFNVGGIPELPLRDNRVNYNAYVNRFEPKDEYADGGYIETELTDDEIQAYREGGYIVEDISVPSLNQFPDGGVYKFEERADSKYKKDSKGNWLISNPDTKGKYVAIKDPSGSRTKTLNRWAESQDMSKEYEKNVGAANKKRSDAVKGFEESIDFNALPSETLNKVSSDYLGNFGQKSKNIFADAQNKKAVLKNIRKEDEKVAHVQNTAREVLKAKNLTPEQKKAYMNNPEAMSQLAAEYYDYKVAPEEKNFSVMNTMGTSTPYHFKKSEFNVLPYETKKTNLSSALPSLNNITGYNIPSMLPDKQVTVKPGKLSKWNPIPGRDELPKNAASGAVDMLDEYYVSGLLGGLALPEMYSATNAISKFAPIKSLPALNVGNALTAKGVYDAGTEYIPEAVETYKKASKEGWNLKNQANFGYNTLKAGLSLVPLSQSLKNTKVVKNVKNAFSTGEYGTKLAQNPYDPSTHWKAIRAFGSLAGARKEGGETKHVDTELTDAEIQDLIDEGYIVELL